MLESLTRLREAQVQEASAIAALVNAANANDGGRGWTHESGLFEGQRTDTYEIRDLLSVPGATFLLATRDDAIVGCAYLKPTAGSAYFGMLSVRPDMQGLGIASTLMSECERRARDIWLLRTVRITVITTHRPELTAFYERRGYRRTGRFKAAFDRRQTLLAPMRTAGLRPEWMEKVLVSDIETTRGSA